MKKLFLTAALLAVPSFVVAADAKLSGENTTVTFTGTKKDGKHSGGFKALSGTVSYDSADLTKTKISVTIDVNSMFSDDDKLTGHLKSPDFFDVKNNPTSKFETTKIEKGADGYTVTGNLTLLGKTKTITFPAKLMVDGGKFTMTSDFKIKRSEFGMTYGAGKVDDDVSLNLKVAAK